jgi:hypothetical protein
VICPPEKGTQEERMLTREELRQRIEPLASTVDAPRVEAALQELQRQGEDAGGGIEAFRLAHYLLACLKGNPSLTETEVTWGYPYLKPAIAAAIEELPGYELIEGD